MSHPDLAENPIFKQVSSSRMCYTHALEVPDLMTLKGTLMTAVDEFAGIHSKQDVLDFLSTMDIICTDDSEEDEVYAFNMREFLETYLDAN